MFNKVKFMVVNALLLTSLVLAGSVAEARLSIGGIPITGVGSLEIDTLLKGIRNSDLAGSILTVRVISIEWTGIRCINSGGNAEPPNNDTFNAVIEVSVAQTGALFTDGRGNVVSNITITDDTLRTALQQAITDDPTLIEGVCPNPNWSVNISNAFLDTFNLDAIASFCVDDANRIVPCPDLTIAPPGLLTFDVRPEDRIGGHYEFDGTPTYAGSLLCDGLSACATFFGFPAPTELTVEVPAP